jgi:hypothetical protein
MIKCLSTCVVILLSATHMCTAQRTGRVLLDLSPAGTTTYILDGKYRMSDRQLDLMEGPHRFVFWAPERRMLDTTIVVLPGAQVEARIELRYSDEYVTWRKQNERASQQIGWLRYGPPVVMAGSAALMVVSFLRHEQAYKDLNALNDEYLAQVDPGRIADIKRVELPAAKDAFSRTRTGAVISSSVFVLSTAATLYLRNKARNTMQAPFEDKERVRFEGLVYAPLPQGAVWGASLSVPLVR